MRREAPPNVGVPSADADRPWPMVLLLGLGGWLAALPLLGALGLLLGDYPRDRPALLIVFGAAMLAGAVFVLRKLQGRLLIEQGAFPTLLAGGGLLAWGLYATLPDPAAAVLLALAAAAIACCVPQRWLATILGAAGAAALPFAADGHATAWWAIQHANIAIWLAATQLLPRASAEALAGASTRVAAWFAGWLACTLAGLCFWSGTTFMAGGLPLIGLFAGGAGAGAAGGTAAATASAAALAAALCALSVAMAIAAAVALARKLPALRQPWCAAVALTLLVFTWFMPALGGVLLVLAGCIVQQRYRLATASALAAAWVIGSAYYQLTWTLNQKAAVFAIAGITIVALASRAHLAAATGPAADIAPLAQPAAQPAASPRRTGIGVAACLLAVLVVANASIWRNEDLIANSEIVFVELAPVDPRSMLQGDFMRLAVRLPAGIEQANGSHAMAIGLRDQRGVVQLQRLDNGKAPGAGELRIALTRKDGRWILASDAWFFQEGEAKRFENARYGEYHVRKDGRALLTGLRGPALEKL